MIRRHTKRRSNIHSTYDVRLEKCCSQAIYRAYRGSPPDVHFASFVLENFKFMAPYPASFRRLHPQLHFRHDVNVKGPLTAIKSFCISRCWCFSLPHRKRKVQKTKRDRRAWMFAECNIDVPVEERYRRFEHLAV